MGVLRIIPARAGFTLASRSATVANADHPRSRGVYHSDYSFSSSTRGSSPLARGLHFREEIVHESLPDHPRSRGVYVLACDIRVLSEGSSPLARGLRQATCYENIFSGIIPARAGFTQESCARPGDGEDHPRSRGVYSPTTSRRGVASGSSPLARGLPSWPG